MDSSIGHILINSPMASGKTTQVLELLSSGLNVLFLSPLRAIADEFEQRCLGKEISCHNPRDVSSLKTSLIDFLNNKFNALVTTPELLIFAGVTSNDLNKGNFLIVLDEVHLFINWGGDFRPILMEFLWGLSEIKQSVIMLSATVSKENLNFLRELAYSSHANFHLINSGNFSFKHSPSQIMINPFIKQDFLKLYITEKLKNLKKCFLLFCQYRSEVDEYVSYFRAKGVLVIGCKGGEIKEFLEKLEKSPNPQLIVSTQVLSHGVNLPSIASIVVSHKVINPEMIFQMTGRGGRDGEFFEVLLKNDVFSRTIVEKIKYLCCGIAIHIKILLLNWIKN